MGTKLEGAPICDYIKESSVTMAAVAVVTWSFSAGIRRPEAQSYY